MKYLSWPLANPTGAYLNSDSQCQRFCSPNALENEMASAERRKTRLVFREAKPTS